MASKPADVQDMISMVSEPPDAQDLRSLWFLNAQRSGLMISIVLELAGAHEGELTHGRLIPNPGTYAPWFVAHSPRGMNMPCGCGT